MMKIKNTKYLIIAVATLIVFTIAGTYAFFRVLGGTSVSKTVNVQTYTTDILTFNVSDNIEIEADQADFGRSAGNKIVWCWGSPRSCGLNSSGSAYCTGS